MLITAIGATAVGSLIAMRHTTIGIATESIIVMYITAIGTAVGSLIIMHMIGDGGMSLVCFAVCHAIVGMISCRLAISIAPHIAARLTTKGHVA